MICKHYIFLIYYIIYLSKPLLFLLKVKNKLSENQINSRRYFFPSLNKLPYLEHSTPCPVSEDIANRVLCLPLYYSIEPSSIKSISNIVNEAV